MVNRDKYRMAIGSHFLPRKLNNKVFEVELWADIRLCEEINTYHMHRLSSKNLNAMKVNENTFRNKSAIN